MWYFEASFSLTIGVREIGESAYCTRAPFSRNVGIFRCGTFGSTQHEACISSSFICGADGPPHWGSVTAKMFSLPLANLHVLFSSCRKRSDRRPTRHLLLAHCRAFTGPSTFLRLRRVLTRKLRSTRSLGQQPTRILLPTFATVVRIYARLSRIAELARHMFQHSRSD